MNGYIYQTYGISEINTVEEKHIFAEDDGTEDKVINLYPEMTYQIMEGFGGALTDAAGFVFSKLTEAQKEQVLNQYFTEENMNYQMVRMHIDSCDFSTHMYAADNTKDDYEFKDFQFLDVEQYMLPLLDEVQKKRGKKIPIMLSPWSPPAYMKTNQNRKEGGSLKKEYFQAWADYICRYIKEYKARGYEVNRLSIQNEPKAVQTWDSCVYSAAEEKIFLRDYLYPSLLKNSLQSIEIFIWDHNKERAFERACEIIDESTDTMISGIAFHWYSGDHFDALSLIHEKFPDKKLILSESCLELAKYENDAEYVNAGRLAHDMIGNLNHGMCSFYDWNILLDEKGGPNHVGNYCDAPYLFDMQKKELKERLILKYYYHFTHFIKPQAIRIASTCYSADLDVTAWKNKDASLTVVVLNRTKEDKEFALRNQGKMMMGIAKAASISSIMITEEETYD